VKGGFALGLDRLLMIMCDTKSLTDVIAFPKSASGNEIMTGAPSIAPDSLLSEYHLKVKTS